MLRCSPARSGPAGRPIRRGSRWRPTPERGCVWSAAGSPRPLAAGRSPQKPLLLEDAIATQASSADRIGRTGNRSSSFPIALPLRIWPSIWLRWAGMSRSLPAVILPHNPAPVRLRSRRPALPPPGGSPTVSGSGARPTARPLLGYRHAKAPGHAGPAVNAASFSHAPRPSSEPSTRPRPAGTRPNARPRTSQRRLE